MVDWLDYYENGVSSDDPEFVREADREMRDLIEWEGDMHPMEEDLVRLCAEKIEEVSWDMVEGETILAHFAFAASCFGSEGQEISPHDLAVGVFARFVANREWGEEVAEGLDEEVFVLLYDSL